MEIGADLGRPVTQLLREVGYTAAIYQDYACRDRGGRRIGWRRELAGASADGQDRVHGGAGIYRRSHRQRSKNAALPVLIFLY